MKNKHIAALIATSLFFFTAPTALANNNDWDDQEELHYQQNQAQYITHQKAAQAALDKVGGGKVEDVEFEHSRRGAYFDVEVRDTHGREWDVRVDAKNGNVLSSRRDY